MWSIFVPRENIWRGGEGFQDGVAFLMQAEHVRVIWVISGRHPWGERHPGRKAVRQKGLRQPLTFLYAGTESPDMVLPETLTIRDRSIRKMQTPPSARDCMWSKNSPERRVKYTRSNQPFTERPMRNTFNSTRWSHTGGIRLQRWEITSGITRVTDDTMRHVQHHKSMEIIYFSSPVFSFSRVRWRGTLHNTWPFPFGWTVPLKMLHCCEPIKSDRLLMLHVKHKILTSLFSNHNNHISHLYVPLFMITT